MSCIDMKSQIRMQWIVRIKYEIYMWKIWPRYLKPYNSNWRLIKSPHFTNLLNCELSQFRTWSTRDWWKWATWKMAMIVVCYVILYNKTSKRVSKQNWWYCKTCTNEVSNITRMCLLKYLEWTINKTTTNTSEWQRNYAKLPGECQQQMQMVNHFHPENSYQVRTRNLNYQWNENGLSKAI